MQSKTSQNNASNTQSKSILTVCCGTMADDGIHRCDYIKDEYGEWFDKEAFEFIYGNMDFSNYSLSHGLCPDCRDKTYEQIKNLHKKQG